MEKTYILIESDEYGENKEIKFVTTNLVLLEEKICKLLEDYYNQEYFEDRFSCDIWENNKYIGYLRIKTKIVHNLKNLEEVII